MSHDLLLSKFPSVFPSVTRKSWARDDVTRETPPSTTPTTPQVVPTSEERKRLEKLASLRVRVESGDKRARRAWRRALSQVAALRARARGGDSRAARACQVLDDSGVLGKFQKIAVSGYTERKTYLASASVESGKTATLVLEPLVALANPTLTATTEDGYDNFHLAGIVRGGKRILPGATVLSLREGLVVPGVVSKDSPVKLVVRYTGAGRGILKAQLNTTSVSGRSEIGRQLARDSRNQFFSGSGNEELLGEFVGDEERLSREAGPAERSAAARVSGAYPRSRRRGQRGRSLRKLVWRASRGDAGSAARLQQVTARLRQRSAAGDARATALLQKVQSMQARAQAAATTQPADAATSTPTYTQPPATAPTANVTYSAPYASSEETEYDDE